LASDQGVAGSTPAERANQHITEMTIYNILFPFLILVILGVVIYILTKHLPEAVEQHEILEQEEKKRWWQVFLGKGENILRSLRVLLLKLDNHLNDSIKKVRERKEDMGKGLKEYRDRRRQKTFQENIPLEKENTSGIESDGTAIEKVSLWDNNAATDESGDEFSSSEGDNDSEGLESNQNKISFAKRVSSVFRHAPQKSSREPKKSKAVEEIIKKTFTPVEIKVEKEQYWKKKEAFLIQSIVREPRNVGLYIQLGRLYTNQHNWLDARNAFLEVIKLDKTNIKAKEELKRIEKYLND
jgi:hypothetical protein